MSRRGWIYLAVLIALLFSVAIGQMRHVRAADHPSDSDWAKILRSNGFDNSGKLLIGLEIVFTESGGDCNATNPSGARGCWQFMVNTLADDTCARDSVCSTRAAYTTSKNATDWSKWTTYPTAAKAQEARARTAIAAAAPGCDWVMDPNCFLKMVWTAAPQGNPGGAPSLDQASPLDILDIWTKLPLDKIGDFSIELAAYTLGVVDSYLMKAFEAIWHGMVAGEDNLGGQTHWGSALVLDSTPVFKFWVFMVGICSGGLAVLLLTIGIITRMLTGSTHELWRDVLYAVVGIILMATSFWLMQAVLGLANAFTNSVDAFVGLELRSLSVYQGLAVQQFTIQNILADHAKALVEAIAILFIGVELLLLLFVYLVRAIKIWALAVMLPLAIAAGFVPAGRGLTTWWLRTFLATVLIKPVNAVLFGLYLLVGVTADGFINAIVLLGMLWVMWKVPGWLHEAFSESRISGVQDAAHKLIAAKATGDALGYVGRALRLKAA